MAADAASYARAHGEAAGAAQRHGGRGGRGAPAHSPPALGARLWPPRPPWGPGSAPARSPSHLRVRCLYERCLGINGYTRRPFLFPGGSFLGWPWGSPPSLPAPPGKKTNSSETCSAGVGTAGRQGWSPGDAPRGGGGPPLPSPPRNTVGAALPRARGGLLRGPRVRKAPGSPGCFASELSLGRSFARRRRRRNEGEGAGRGGEGRRPPEGFRAPRINQIRALERDSRSFHGAAGVGPPHGSLLPCLGRQFRSHPSRASPGALPCPLAGGQGDPSPPPPRQPGGRSRRGVN